MSTMKTSLQITKWCMFIYIFTCHLPRTHSQKVMSLEIGNCDLTFSKDALISFQECLCNDHTQKCNIPVKFNVWKSRYQAQSSIRSESARNNTISTSRHFMCDAICQHGLVGYTLHSFSCSAAPPGTRQHRCKYGQKCDFQLDLRQNTACDISCLDIRWVVPAKIQVDIENTDLIQYGMCPTGSVVTTPTSTDVRKTTTMQTTRSSSATSEDDADAAAADQDIFSRDLVIYCSLAAAVAVIILITTLCFVCWKRRDKSSYKQESGNMYITPINVIYSSQEVLDQTHTSLDYEGSVQDGSLCFSRAHASHENCVTNQNEYSELACDNSVSCGGSNQSTRNEVTRSTGSSRLKNVIMTDTDLPHVYSDLGEPVKKLAVPYDVHVIQHSDPHQENVLLSPRDVAASSVIDKQHQQYSTLSDEKNTSHVESTHSNSYETYNMDKNMFSATINITTDPATNNTHSTPVAKNPQHRAGNELSHSKMPDHISFKSKNNVGKGVADIKENVISSLNEDTRAHSSKPGGQSNNNTNVCTQHVYSLLGQHNHNPVNVYDDMSSVAKELNFKADTSLSSLADDNISKSGRVHQIENTEEPLEENPYNNDGANCNDHEKCKSNLITCNSDYNNQSVVKYEKSDSESPYMNYNDLNS